MIHRITNGFELTAEYDDESTFVEIHNGKFIIPLTNEITLDFAGVSYYDLIFDLRSNVIIYSEEQVFDYDEKLKINVKKNGFKFYESKINYYYIPDVLEEYLDEIPLICIYDTENVLDNCIYDNNASIISDPGENTIIMVFSDVEINSTIFSYDHDVIFKYPCTLTLNSVSYIQENFNNKLKIDHLLFTSGDRLVVKPQMEELEVTARIVGDQHEITVEIQGDLLLKVTNSNATEKVFPTLNVKGKGELNIPEYDFSSIKTRPTVKVIKCIYIVCNSSNYECPSSDEYKNYKVLSTFNKFEERSYDRNSKIYVFLNSFTDVIDVDVNFFENQQILFDDLSNSKLLETTNTLRVLSTTTIINKADKSSKL